MLDVSSTDEIGRLRLERDLYRRILDLGATDEIETFVAEALRLFVELSGAARAHIELFGAAGLDAGVRWSMSEQCSSEDVAELRRLLSRSAVAAALECGRTILAPWPGTESRPHDRTNGREAVLCAPIGTETPVGVVYLQSREGGQPFGEDDRTRVELFARHLAPLCDRLLVRQLLLASEDATRPWREKLKLNGVIGHSRALADALQEAAAAAPLRDVTVLLTGESGTGKTQLARIIHENSPRSGGPFVELNTAAIPESLVESELFGSAPGAHSAAMRGAQGKVAAAQSGTLFLDEIAELPSSAQAKLLQLLHSKEYYPLGASRSQRADIRIIAATNADLAQAVAAGRFREDLYYRLDVLRIRAPALSERREDIPELARFLCDQACSRNGLPRIVLSSAAVVAAQAADWPGNVRQLSNAVERAVARASAAGLPVADYGHLFSELGGDDRSTVPLSWQEATRRFQRELLARTLKETGGNVSEVARRLGLVRSHVYTMMNAFGLGKPPAE